MSNLLTRNMKDDITVWPTSDGAFSGYTFGAPSVQKGRWRDVAALFRTPGGEEATSKAVIHLTSDVAIGDYIANGDFQDIADPTTLTGSYRIRQFNKTSDLRNVQMVRKAYV